MTLFLRVLDRFLPILGLDFFSILTPLFLYQIISDYPIELSIVRSDLPDHRSDEGAPTGTYTVTTHKATTVLDKHSFSALYPVNSIVLSHLKRFRPIWTTFKQSN